MRKITVNKSDEAAVVVEKIIETDAKQVVLSIPRFSHLAGSLSNFHLLKREAEALGKELFIESVDDRVIELAGLSKLKSVNPFFSKNKRNFSDIVAPTVSKRKRKLLVEKNFWNEDEDQEKSEQYFWDKQSGFLESESLETEKQSKLMKLRKFLPPLKMPRFRVSSLPRFPWKISLFLILVIAGIWILFKELPRATITINAKTADWSYNDSILTDRTAKADSKNLTIPNQAFSQKKNLELKFSATGKKQVERKAGGKILVYNSYSSDPQPLVANTRFISPEGKLFRLTKNIVVPGAKISEGKIIPSNIETEVIADAAGTDYNISPVKLFTIPGFKGTPKYQAFYGESKEAMAGGFIGEVGYPTANDISAAKTNIAKALEDGLKVAVYSQIPAEFKILPDAAHFKITNQTIKEEVDENNNFSIFSEAKINIIGFRESDLLGVLIKRAEEERGSEYEVISKKLGYGISRADFESGKMSFLVNFKANMRYKIDLELLRNRISGRSELDLRAIIFSLPGINSASISLWPFWVNKVPVDTERVKIKVEPVSA